MDSTHVARVDRPCWVLRGVTCTDCISICETQAVSIFQTSAGTRIAEIDIDRCTGCGACARVCAAGAIAMGLLVG